MEIVDAQIHEPDSIVPWEYGDESRLAMSCELAREAMDSVGVDAALVNARVEFCTAAVSRYPERFGACVMADVHTPDLDDFRSRKGMLALRVLLRSWNDGKLSKEFQEGGFERLFAAAERNNIPVFAQAAGHIRALIPVIEAHPDLILILDHLGLNQQPSMVARDPWEQLRDVNALAKFPNVAVKLSGAPTLAQEPYPYRDIWPHVLSMVEAFGPQRLMWGSDFTRLRYAPRTVIRGPRDSWYGLYSDSVSFLRDTNEISRSDKELIFGGTIRHLLRWPRPTEASGSTM